MRPLLHDQLAAAHDDGRITVTLHLIRSPAAWTTDIAMFLDSS
jgi:hypothetical protein